MEKVVLIFLAGVISDCLVTINWIMVQKERPFLASFFSFLATITAMAVTYEIVQSVSVIKDILIYSVGVGCGTFLGMKIKIGGEQRG